VGRSDVVSAQGSAYDIGMFRGDDNDDHGVSCLHSNRDNDDHGYSDVSDWMWPGNDHSYCGYHDPDVLWYFDQGYADPYHHVIPNVDNCVYRDPCVYHPFASDPYSWMVRNDFEDNGAGP
jgi:hypothetical protein